MALDPAMIDLTAPVADDPGASIDLAASLPSSDPGASIDLTAPTPTEVVPQTSAAVQGVQADARQQAEEWFTRMNRRVRAELDKPWYQRLKEGAAANVQNFVPFLGGAVDAGQSLAVLRAVNRVQEGTGTDEDLALIRQTIDEQERPSSMARSIGAGLVSLPGFAGEFILTGPVYSAARAGTARVVTRALTGVAGKAAAEFAARQTGRVAGVAAQTLAAEAGTAAVGGSGQLAGIDFLAPGGRVTAGAAQRMTPSVAVDPGWTTDMSPEQQLVITADNQDFLEAAFKSFGAQAVEMGTERFGDLLKGVSGLQKLKAAAWARWQRIVPRARQIETFERIAKGAHWNGFLEEIAEEEVAKPILAISGWESSRRGEDDTMENRFRDAYRNFWSDLAVEAAVVAVPSGANLALSSLNRGPAEQTRAEAVADLAETYLRAGVTRVASPDPDVRREAAQAQWSAASRLVDEAQAQETDPAKRAGYYQAAALLADTQNQRGEEAIQKNLDAVSEILGAAATEGKTEVGKALVEARDALVAETEQAKTADQIDLTRPEPKPPVPAAELAPVKLAPPAAPVPAATTLTAARIHPGAQFREGATRSTIGPVVAGVATVTTRDAAGVETTAEVPVQKLAGRPVDEFTPRALPNVSVTDRGRLTPEALDQTITRIEEALPKAEALRKPADATILGQMREKAAQARDALGTAQDKVTEALDIFGENLPLYEQTYQQPVRNVNDLNKLVTQMAANPAEREKSGPIVDQLVTLASEAVAAQEQGRNLEADLWQLNEKIVAPSVRVARPDARLLAKTTAEAKAGMMTPTVAAEVPAPLPEAAEPPPAPPVETPEDLPLQILSQTRFAIVDAEGGLRSFQGVPAETEAKALAKIQESASIEAVTTPIPIDGRLLSSLVTFTRNANVFAAAHEFYHAISGILPADTITTLNKWVDDLLNSPRPTFVKWREENSALYRQMTSPDQAVALKNRDEFLARAFEYVAQSLYANDKVRSARGMKSLDIRVKAWQAALEETTGIPVARLFGQLADLWRRLRAAASSILFDQKAFGGFGNYLQTPAYRKMVDLLRPPAETKLSDAARALMAQRKGEIIRSFEMLAMANVGRAAPEVSLTKLDEGRAQGTVAAAIYENVVLNLANLTTTQRKEVATRSPAVREALFGKGALMPADAREPGEKGLWETMVGLLVNSPLVKSLVTRGRALASEPERRSLSRAQRVAAGVPSEMRKDLYDAPLAYLLGSIGSEGVTEEGRKLAERIRQELERLLFTSVPAVDFQGNPTGMMTVPYAQSIADQFMRMAQTNVARSQDPVVVSAWAKLEAGARFDRLSAGEQDALRQLVQGFVSDKMTGNTGQAVALVKLGEGEYALPEADRKTRFLVEEVPQTGPDGVIRPLLAFKTGPAVALQALAQTVVEREAVRRSTPYVEARPDEGQAGVEVSTEQAKAALPERQAEPSAPPPAAAPAMQTTSGGVGLELTSAEVTAALDYADFLAHATLTENRAAAGKRSDTLAARAEESVGTVEETEAADEYDAHTAMVTALDDYSKRRTPKSALAALKATADYARVSSEQEFSETDRQKMTLAAEGLRKALAATRTVVPASKASDPRWDAAEGVRNNTALQKTIEQGNPYDFDQSVYDGLVRGDVDITTAKRNADYLNREATPHVAALAGKSLPEVVSYLNQAHLDPAVLMATLYWTINDPDRPYDERMMLAKMLGEHATASGQGNAFLAQIMLDTQVGRDMAALEAGQQVDVRENVANEAADQAAARKTAEALRLYQESEQKPTVPDAEAADAEAQGNTIVVDAVYRAIVNRSHDTYDPDFKIAHRLFDGLLPADESKASDPNPERPLPLVEQIAVSAKGLVRELLLTPGTKTITALRVADVLMEQYGKRWPADAVIQTKIRHQMRLLADSVIAHNMQDLAAGAQQTGESLPPEVPEDMTAGPDEESPEERAAGDLAQAMVAAVRLPRAPETIQELGGLRQKYRRVVREFVAAAVGQGMLVRGKPSDVKLSPGDMIRWLADPANRGAAQSIWERAIEETRLWVEAHPGAEVSDMVVGQSEAAAVRASASYTDEEWNALIEDGLKTILEGGHLAPLFSAARVKQLADYYLAHRSEALLARSELVKRGIHGRTTLSRIARRLFAQGVTAADQQGFDVSLANAIADDPEFEMLDDVAKAELRGALTTYFRGTLAERLASLAKSDAVDTRVKNWLSSLATAEPTLPTASATIAGQVMAVLRDAGLLQKRDADGRPTDITRSVYSRVAAIMRAGRTTSQIVGDVVADLNRQIAEARGPGQSLSEADALALSRKLTLRLGSLLEDPAAVAALGDVTARQIGSMLAEAQRALRVTINRMIRSPGSEQRRTRAELEEWIVDQLGFDSDPNGDSFLGDWPDVRRLIADVMGVYDEKMRDARRQHLHNVLSHKTSAMTPVQVTYYDKIIDRLNTLSDLGQRDLELEQRLVDYMRQDRSTIGDGRLEKMMAESRRIAALEEAQLAAYPPTLSAEERMQARNRVRQSGAFKHAVKQFLRARQELLGFSKFDRFLAVFMPNILSGVSVPEGNLTSTFDLLMSTRPAYAFANHLAGVDARGRALPMGQWKWDWKGFFGALAAIPRGLAAGGRAFGTIMRTGEAPGAAFSLASAQKMAPYGSEMDPFTGKYSRLLNWGKYIMRMLTASDYLFGSASYEAQMTTRARLLAQQFGLTETQEIMVRSSLIARDGQFDPSTVAGRENLAMAAKSMDADAGAFLATRVDALKSAAAQAYAKVTQQVEFDRMREEAGDAFDETAAWNALAERFASDPTRTMPTAADIESWLAKASPAQRTTYYALMNEELFQTSLSAQEQERVRREVGLDTYNLAPGDKVYDDITIMGKTRQLTEAFAQQFPATKLVIPFINIVARVFDFSLDHSVIGLWRAHKMGRLNAEARVQGLAVPFTDEAIIALRAKAVAGSALTTSFLLAGVFSAGADDDEDDWFQITGLGAANARQRAIAKESRGYGYQEMSLRIGSTWVSYKYTPFAIPFSVFGNALDYLRYDASRQDPNGTTASRARGVFAALLTRALPTLFDQTFLSNTTGLMDVITGSGDEAREKALTRFLARTASSAIPVFGSNFVKQLYATFDPTLYETGTQYNKLISAFLREIPMPASLKGAAVLPRYNVLGEPIQQNSPSLVLSLIGAATRGQAPVGLGRFAQLAQRSDPAWMFLQRNNLTLAAVNQDESLLGPVRMPDAMRQEYIIRRGALLKRVLTLMAQDPRYSQMPPGELQKLVSQISAWVSRSTKASLLAQQPYAQMARETLIQASREARLALARRVPAPTP